MIDPNMATLGYDVTYELDKFGKPRLRRPAEIIKNCILYICFSKPGQYPSLPWIGLDLESLLYSFYDDIVEVELQDLIISQCEALGIYFGNGYVSVRKTIYRDKPSLMIHIQSNTDGISNDEENDKYQIGITFNDMDQMIHSIR